MKKKHFLFLLFLILFFIINLNGGFWIKKFDSFSAGQIYGQLIYEDKSGNFFCFNGYYSVFDITGKVDYYGDFEIDSNKAFQHYDAIRLDDGTFLSFGTYWDNVRGPQGYYILKITRDGQILFFKEFKDDLVGYWWRYTELLSHDNKIKVIYKYDDIDENSYLRISTLSRNGALLKSKILDRRGGHFSISASHVSSIEIDSDYYGIITNGQFEMNNIWYEGILFLKLNKNDEIIKSKWYYIKDGDDSPGYGNLIIKKESDRGFSILARKEGTDTLCFLKIDSEWKLKWSSEYYMGLDPDWTLSPVNFFEDSTGYIIGITIENKIHDMYFSPVILKINKNGGFVWAKKYFKDGYQYEWLTDLIKLENGGMALASAHFYILDDNGEVPGNCEIPEQVVVEAKNLTFHEETPNKKDFKLSNLNLVLEDVNISFDRSETSETDTVCEYNTMEGEVEFIEERSIFMGYLIHRINFKVDSIISPYISKFKIYRISTPGDNYVYVTEIPREAGKTSYEVEFKPLYTRSCTYVILAVNPGDEVVDMVYLTD